MQWPVRRPAGRGFGCLSVWLWRLPPSARWGARSACLPARRAATQMAATKAAAQTGAPETADAGSGTGGSDVDDGVGDWDASSGTGSSNTCGAVRRLRTLGVRELVTPRALVVTPLLMNH